VRVELEIQEAANIWGIILAATGYSMKTANYERLNKILETVSETPAEMKKINRIGNLQVGELTLSKDYERVNNELMMIKKETRRQIIIIRYLNEIDGEDEEDLTEEVPM